ncbi:hypothetical protein IAR50_001309 [Cryptococcus sp. DSM 104548]
MFTTSLILLLLPLVTAYPRRPEQQLHLSGDAASQLLSAHAKLGTSKSFTQDLLEKSSSYSTYFGIRSFARLPPTRCWKEDQDVEFDLAVLGAPFDTATTWRPGARFGPSGIREGSSRTGGWGFSESWGWNPELKVDPFATLAMVDCGDVPMTNFDNTDALKSLEKHYLNVLQRQIPLDSISNLDAAQTHSHVQGKDGKYHPKIVTLGGDHTILLPVLKAVHAVYGPVSVIHMDSHQDTFSPFEENTSEYAMINHGTMLWHAAKNGLIKNGTNIHAGLKSALRGPADYDTDDWAGFARVEAWEMDNLGPHGVVQRVIDRVGSGPVYLSIDIDVIDMAIAPATGTPEVGGWTLREVKQILHGFKDLNIVGMDVVEVAPAYDSNEITTTAAAKLINEMMGVWALQYQGK